METLVIDSQVWRISTRYKKDLRSLTFPKCGSDFISINSTHPPQDFTSSVLTQAFDAYITRYPNVPSQLRRQVMQRVRLSQTPSLSSILADSEQKESKPAQKFLAKRERLAAKAKARAESKDRVETEAGAETKPRRAKTEARAKMKAHAEANARSESKDRVEIEAGAETEARSKLKAYAMKAHAGTEAWVERGARAEKEAGADAKGRRAKTEARAKMAPYAETHAANSSSDTSSNDSEPETETETDLVQNSRDCGMEDIRDNMEGIVLAADPADSDSIEDDTEGEDTIQSSEDEEDGPSLTTGRHREVETPEVDDDRHEHKIESSCASSENEDKMSIDDEPQVDTSCSRKRRVCLPSGKARAPC